MAVSYTRIKTGVKPTQLRTELNTAIAIECLYVRVDEDRDVTMTFASALNTGQIATMESVLAAHVASQSEIDRYSPTMTTPDAVWSSMVGSIIPVAFLDTTTSFANRWLGTIGDKLPSNTNPFVVPYKSKLVGITFASQTNNCFADAEVYRGSEDGAAVSRVATMQVRGARFQRKTDFNTPIILNAGETIGVYVSRATGDKTRYPLVTVFLQIIEDGFAEKSNNSTNYLMRV